MFLQPSPATSSTAMNFPSSGINSTNLSLTPNSMKERLTKAISHFQSLTRDKTLLIQIWVPVKRGTKNFLTTADQPYSYDPTCSSLANYRHVSANYQFSADEDSKEGLGLPGRVFVRKAPEWTPDVQFFRPDEYQRVNHAMLCDVRGSIALPVFEKESGNCLGVVEIVTTSQKISYRLEAESVCRALEAVDLRSSEILSPSKKWDGSEFHTHNAELSEISHIIRTVCEKHGLPLGQTWAPNNNTYASIIESSCCLLDQRISSFHEACLDQQLFRGQGVVGQAFMTNQPCYAIDVATYSKAEYPLSHHAKILGLCGAVAIHLQHLYGACESYVLEFFLPIDCQDSGLTFHCKIMESLTTLVQDSRSFCFLTRKENQHEETSWISNLVEAQRKGKEVSLSFEFGKDMREINEEAQREQAGSSFGSDNDLGISKTGEKKRTKSQKTISLEVLKQYFAGSLKDAAKSIGVCPTTLKRICRQYGINRWPSRKIKKVDHSLRKLQLVIDSVKGAQGAIQLSSFYSDFPQLSPTAAKTIDPSEQLNALAEETTMISSEESSSESTSSSQTSSSNACGSGDTLTSQDPLKPSKRARIEAELRVPNHKSLAIFERSRSNKSLCEVPQVDNPPFLARNNGNPAQIEGAICKVKATFGEEMIRLTLKPNTGFGDLQCEIAKRFHIGDVSNMYMKYLDDDKEWVLLTCDDDLEECIDIQRSSGSHTVKLSVHEVSTGQGGSFGNKGQS